jgi:hypothetical protein
MAGLSAQTRAAGLLGAVAEDTLLAPVTVTVRTGRTLGRQPSAPGLPDLLVPPRARAMLVVRGGRG